MGILARWRSTIDSIAKFELKNKQVEQPSLQIHVLTYCCVIMFEYHLPLN
jgi:hypothetical protein